MLGHSVATSGGVVSGVVVSGGVVVVVVSGGVVSGVVVSGGVVVVVVSGGAVVVGTAFQLGGDGFDGGAWQGSADGRRWGRAGRDGANPQAGDGLLVSLVEFGVGSGGVVLFGYFNTKPCLRRSCLEHRFY